MAEQKPIGEVTHYYDKIGVAVIKFNKAAKSGDMIQIRGAHTDFTQAIGSMQFDHKNIDSVKKGEEVGMKVDGKVHEGDQIFEA